MPQSVTLLYWREQRSPSLLVLLGRLPQVTTIGWPDQVAKGAGLADVVWSTCPGRSGAVSVNRSAATTTVG
jgi:hypothetical protein